MTEEINGQDIAEVYAVGFIDGYNFDRWIEKSWEQLKEKCKKAFGIRFIGTSKSQELIKSEMKKNDRKRKRTKTRSCFIPTGTKASGKSSNNKDVAGHDKLSYRQSGSSSSKNGKS